MHRINLTLVCFLIFTIISSGLAYKIVISAYATYDQSLEDGQFLVLPVHNGNMEVNKKLITISYPKKGALIESPVFIKGEAVGTWYFEASFPVHLLDSEGVEIASGSAMAKGNWMTTDFVPFELTLQFAKPATSTGTLVFQKDNPSGDASKDESISMAIKF